MKRITNYMTTAAAVLMMTAGVASAQSIMKAEVPFAFHVGGNVMEPGTIRVQVMGGNTGNGALIVNNYDARRSYIVLPKSVGDAPKSWVASGSAEAGLRLQLWDLHPGEGLERRGQRLRVLQPQEQGRRDSAHRDRDDPGPGQLIESQHTEAAPLSQGVAPLLFWRGPSRKGRAARFFPVNGAVQPGRTGRFTKAAETRRRGVGRHAFSMTWRARSRMAQWPAGCILFLRKPGTQRRPEGGNDETHNELRDDRCGRPD